MKIYNTLSKDIEIFEPIKPPLVRMYVCGPTPYDHTHIGHVRAYVAFDIIRRYLEFKGYRVFMVMNITDIDDKILKRAVEENVEWREIPEKYTREFLEVIEELHILKPHIMPRVTEHIDDIISFILKLVEKGYAYESRGSVYFEVDKFEDYGKLSGKVKSEEWRQEEMLVEEKKKPYDFALWKKAKPGEPCWNSPWGMGRPGWHIECSVMSSKYLGEQFDIHGGGRDLIFPHHENEIAQSEAMFGKKPWVKYWVHVGYLTVRGEKMSKSLGNIIPAKELLKKYNYNIIRTYIASTHYRSQLDFSFEGLEHASRIYKRMINTIKMCKAVLRDLEPPSRIDDNINDEIVKLQSDIAGFYNYMDEDFNTTRAMAYLHKALTLVNKMVSEEKNYPGIILGFEFLKSISKIFGIGEEEFKVERGEEKVEKLIELLVEVRSKYRSVKDWEKADWIRSELEKLGVKLVDYKDKTLWYLE